MEAEDAGVRRVLTQLFDFLGLPLVPAVRAAWAAARARREHLEAHRVLELDSLQKRHVARQARFDLYQELLERVAKRPRP